MEQPGTDETRVDDEPRDDAEESGAARGGGRGGAFSEIQEIVEDFFEGFRPFGGTPGGSHPRLEWMDTPEAHVVSFDLPGVPRERVEVSTVGDEITVSGTRPRPDYPEGARVRTSERRYGRFRRTFRVPSDVDAGRVRAKLANGVLELTLPRRAETEGRRIEIEEVDQG